MFATCASAIDPIPDKNVVDTTITCNEDYDCDYQQLDYITGDGKPRSNGDVCCATFPRDMWNPEK